MRLTVICSEPPYPPNTGGRTDVWNRLKAFKDREVALQLICWQSERFAPVTPEEVVAIQNLVDELIVCRIGFDFPSLLRRFCHLWRYPSQVASRILRSSELKPIQAAVERFRPDAIWIDQIYGAVLAKELSEVLRKPIYVRSQNIEHHYFGQQVLAEHRIKRKLALNLTSMHLRKFETDFLRESKIFFDISVEDLSFWRTQGLENGRWLPAILSRPCIKVNSGDAFMYDVGFLGNLHTPNNVEGVTWLIDNVLPKLLEKRPEITVAIAGSNPEDAIRNLCSKHEQVILIENPESAHDFFSSASVLVNPVHRGSGVNVKSVEMLFTDRPIVTTSAGVRGLPDDVKQCFSIADTPDSMSNMILAYLHEHETLKGNRNRVRRYFLPDAIDQVLQEMEKSLGN